MAGQWGVQVLTALKAARLFSASSFSWISSCSLGAERGALGGPGRSPVPPACCPRLLSPSAARSGGNRANCPALPAGGGRAGGGPGALPPIPYYSHRQREHKGMRSARCHAHCPGPYRDEWPAAGGTGGLRGGHQLSPSWGRQQSELGTLLGVRGSGGRHSGSLALGVSSVLWGQLRDVSGEGCRCPRTWLSEPQGDGDAQPRWHRGHQEPDTRLPCALLLP